MKNNKHLKSLTEIVANFSENEHPSANTNIFTNTNVQKIKVGSYSHKINNLESEFYTPDSLENDFSKDMILEQRMTSLRKEIQAIDYKINAEKNFETGDNLKLLVIERKKLQKEYDDVLKMWQTIPFITKLKNKVIYAMKFMFKLLQRFKLSEKLPITFLSATQPAWKENLHKLTKINDEIDEILKPNTPYGENENRYERLSQSLNKALELRKNINKNF